MEVGEQTEDSERPEFWCRVVAEETHRAFRGFNRSQAAVIEASILVSRLDWLPPEKVAVEMTYLTLAVEKTAGERERLAWKWLVDAIARHPRHRIKTETQ